MKNTPTQKPLTEAQVRAGHLRNTLGSLAIEGLHLDKESLAICDRYVRGEIDLDTLGRLFHDDIYAKRPEARLDV